MTQIDKIGFEWTDPNILKNINQTMDQAISRFFQRRTSPQSGEHLAELVAAIYDEWVDYSRDQVSIWYVSLRPITIKLKEIETGKVPQPDIVRWVPFSAQMFDKISSKIQEKTGSFPDPTIEPWISKPQDLPSSYFRSLQTKARNLEQVIHEIGMRGRITQIHAGPTICRYEFNAESDSDDVDRTLQMENDLASALAMEKLRIINFPDKKKLGVEIPNDQRFIVPLKELLDHRSESAPDLWEIPLGRESSTGMIQWGNLKTMRHLLICGAPQSGKTASIRSMICHLLFSCDRTKLHLSLIQWDRDDWKMLNQAPQVISFLQNDPAKALKTLHECVVEMKARSKDLAQYSPSVPSLVVVIDDCAPLFEFDQQATEEAIYQLTSRGHQVGIHVVMAAGVSASEVLSDQIMMNFHSRLVFAVPSLDTSLMMLEQSGAEKLLGNGDALFRLNEDSEPVRIQAAFTSPSDVEQRVNELTHHEQNRKPSKAVDEIYEKAVEFVLESQTASASMLQRRFRIGYARASRLIDHMEKNQIIGPFEGSKPREVLIKRRETSNVT